ncbi:MAG: c-type cytochrome biogenesis protein CcmI [Xanthomonadales bacterium]|nr:c-type cytochrome biogenesis protein CcmI [Xanthomonadales bacterium]
MVAFWILAGLLALVALAFVLRPLLGAPNAAFSGEMRRIRDRVVSLDRALADGHIDPQAHAEKRAALKAEMAALMDQPMPSGRATASAATLILLLPATAIIIYLNVGEPRGVEMPKARPTGSASLANPANGDANENAPDLRQAISGLAARLEENPNDVDGWFLLGQSYMSMSQFAEAEQAFNRAYELAPNNPAILEMYGNAIAFNAGPGTPLPDAARTLFERALSVNPDAQRSLYFLGAGAFQVGDFEGALEYWERLQQGLEPGSEAAVRLADDINAARAELGQAPMTPEAQDTQETTQEAQAAEPVAQAAPEASPAAETPEPREDTPAASDSTGLTVEIELSDNLAAQVSPSDVLFVFARAAEGPRMPLAIQRLPAGSLPVTVRLDESMAMSPAMSLATFPEVVVGARISKSGDAAPRPGDFQALSDPVANDQQEPIRLIIDQVL